jgi:hypothetical protein
MPKQSNSSGSVSWQFVQGIALRGPGVAIFPSRFVPTKLELRHDLRVWDVIAFRFGEGGLLTPALPTGPSRLRLDAWREGMVLAWLWRAVLIILVAIGLKLTSAALVSSVPRALMPLFAGLIAWRFLCEVPHKRELFGYGMIGTGFVTLVYCCFRAEGVLDTVGVAALVTAAIMWAFCSLEVHRAALTSRQATSLVRFRSALLYPPFSFGLGLSNLMRASGEGVALFSLNCTVAPLGRTPLLRLLRSCRS